MVVIAGVTEPWSTVAASTLLVILAGAAVLALVVQVWWRVPRLAATRRQSILRGQIALDLPVGPRAPTGIAVDWGLSGVTATLAVFDDDTINVYFFPRAAIGGSTPIRQLPELIIAGNELRVELRRLGPLFVRANEFPLPQRGEVSFFLIDADGTRVAGPSVIGDLAESNHPLGIAHRLAKRVLAVVCGTLPSIVPGPVMSLVIPPPDSQRRTVAKLSIPSGCLLATSVVTVLVWWAVLAFVNPEAFGFGFGIFIPLFLYAVVIGLVAVLLVALVDLLRRPDRRTLWNLLAAIVGLISFAVVYRMWGWGTE